MVLALVAGVPAPTPSPSPGGGLRTIVTVRSTPYCTNLEQHFNRIVAPMLANDRVLTHVDGTLGDVMESLNKPDFAIRFSDARIALSRDVATLMASLPPMQEQMNALRSGERLTSDPAQSKQMHMLAQELQRGYDRQKQLTSDLHDYLQAMMQFDPTTVDPTSAQNQLELLSMPKDMRDVRSYLRMKGQRDIIADAEDKAGDIAISVVETTCSTR